MPAHLTCFEVQHFPGGVFARVRDNVGRVPAREFTLELNTLRAAFSESGVTNFVVEIQRFSGLNADQLRGLVFLVREARQRGGFCTFCGGGPGTQQALSGFGFSKPADWFPTPADVMTALHGLTAAPAMPVAPAMPAPAVGPVGMPRPVATVRPPSPAAATPAAPRAIAPSAAPAAAYVQAPPRRDASKLPWQPPQRGTFLPAHELTLRAQHRQPILVTAQVCSHLAQQIRAVSDQMKFAVWAFVFMPDHFHLLVQSRQLNYDIGEYIEAVKQAFHEKAVEILGVEAPQVLSRLRKQQGGKYVYEFWQRTSGQNRNVEYTLPVRPLIRHLHENPVRRGLVADPLGWKWSSAGAFAGRPLAECPTDPVPPELLGG